MIYVYVALFLIILWIIFTYNNLIKQRNQVQEAWSDIDIQLKRRHDLIPNLVEIVKGYQHHEAEVMQNVTGLRQQAMQATSITDKAQAEKALSVGLGRLIAVSENYPDLKANTNFLALQKQLSDLEDEIQLARRYYNGCIRDYNIKLQSFPNNFIAKKLHFTAQEFFQTDSEEKNLPTVNFSA